MRRWWARGFARQLILVSAAGLAVRVGYVLLFRTDMTLTGNDAFVYHVGAELLADGYGFIEPLGAVGLLPPEESATHPPLFFLWLAAASLVDPGGASLTLHLLWSCVLGTATVVVCGLVGRVVAGRRCGVVAAAVAAIYPNVWVHDGMLLSETMALFTASLVLLTAYRFWRRPSAWWAAGLGLSCGLAALSRSELVLTLLLVLVPSVLLARAAFTDRLRWLVAGGAAAALALGPWVVFNLSRFEEPVSLSTNFGRTLAAANCDAVYQGDRIGFKDYNCIRRYAAAAGVTEEMDESQLDSAVRQEVSRYIRANRDRLPVVVAARMGRIAGVYRPADDIDFDVFYAERERPLSQAAVYSYYPVAALALAGAVVLRRRRVPVFPLAALPAIVLIGVGLTFAQTRYRAPAEAALVVLAAVAVDAAVRQRAARRRSADPASPPAPEERVPVVASG